VKPDLCLVNNQSRPGAKLGPDAELRLYREQQQKQGHTPHQLTYCVVCCSCDAQCVQEAKLGAINNVCRQPHCVQAVWCFVISRVDRIRNEQQW